jgi:hypothetical protein
VDVAEADERVYAQEHSPPMSALRTSCDLLVSLRLPRCKKRVTRRAVSPATVRRAPGRAGRAA